MHTLNVLDFIIWGRVYASLHDHEVFFKNLIPPIQKLTSQAQFSGEIK